MANHEQAAIRHSVIPLPRAWLVAGLLFQAAFLAGAVVLFRERTLYADTALFTAEIAGGHHLFLGHRLIAALTRLLPLLAASAGASVTAILLLYSLNLALIFTIPWLIVSLVFRDRTLSLVLLLLQFLVTVHTFYLPISELQHGLVLLLVYWAWLGRLISRGKPARFNPLIFVLLALIMNAHPLILIAFAGSAVLLRGQAAYWEIRDQRVLLVFATVVYLFSTLLFHTGYESAMVQRSLPQGQPGLDRAMILLMVQTLWKTYLPALVAGALGLGLLMAGRRHRLNAAIILLLASINALLVYLRFAHGTLTFTFFEIYLLPAAFLLFLALLLHMEILGPARRLAFAALAVLMLYQGYRTLKLGEFYTQRLVLYEKVLQEMKDRGISKAALSFYEAPMSRIWDAYMSPFESYLLSYTDNDLANDGFHFTLLLTDSASLHRYAHYEQAFVAQGRDSIDVHGYDRYPHFLLAPGPYRIFKPDYP